MPAARPLVRRQLALLSALLLMGMLSHPALAVSAADVEAVYADFNAWQYGAARARIEKLVAAEPDDPMVLFLKGQIAFYEGRYQDALTDYNKALGSTRDAALRNQLEYAKRLTQDTYDVSKDYDVATSPNGYFQIRYPKGKDVVLVPYAFEALEEAYVALGKDFGVRPDTPIRIEVYGSAADLARVSPLTEEDIATSGTIALCKYNRLMLTSPKALIRGYGWIDTLVHEYVHMVINIAGRGNIPIWLHEGLAKFSERRWRGGDDARRISPYSEYILHKRATEGNIVTFEQMHPSMAKLPSQEDAAMAFAEVYAAMEYLHEKHGTKGLRQLVQRVGDGLSVEAAIGEITGTSFDAFLKEWTAHLKTRKRRYTGDEPPDIFEQVAFRKRASVGDNNDVALIDEDKAKQYVHIGELLRARNRLGAAVVQYRKASKILGDTNPVLQAKLGKALLDLGRYDESIEAMRRAIDDGEEYGTLYVYLGEAMVNAERWDEAYQMLMEAVALNPFNPAVHAALAKVYHHKGEQDRADMALKHMQLLSRS